MLSFFILLKSSIVISPLFIKFIIFRHTLQEKQLVIYVFFILKEKTDTFLHQLNMFRMEDPIGFEPTIRQLQCRALPLGYGSIYVNIHIIAKQYLFVKGKKCFFIFWHSSIDSANLSGIILV